MKLLIYNMRNIIVIVLKGREYIWILGDLILMILPLSVPCTANRMDI
ncbi:MAG: hypothetical protein LE169_00625 [Endomicrobium sp.]|nr:hypothetical protein [Endomicrobium sp.]